MENNIPAWLFPEIAGIFTDYHWILFVGLLALILRALRSGLSEAFRDLLFVTGIILVFVMCKHFAMEVSEAFSPIREILSR